MTQARRIPSATRLADAFGLGPTMAEEWRHILLHHPFWIAFPLLYNTPRGASWALVDRNGVYIGVRNRRWKLYRGRDPSVIQLVRTR